ncbi:MAG TPA: PAS domain-containing hybrid sensor histidine kinase/response regulator [Beijerinckiaceae bacterium]|nr:PAS domain-containing hybrid sensor histidine kinase/response regulator [Beijerinckiaceae bacterium]
MVDGWLIVLSGLFYLCILFAVAHFGDTAGSRILAGRLRPVIYALTLAVYCTSWTFLGSVGLAARSGYDFLPIYIGPVLVIAFGWSLLARVVKLGKTQNTTSVADMIATRYGKDERVAALVALICVVGMVPYIALQLKAVALSLDLISLPGIQFRPPELGALPFGDGGLWIALILAFFAVAFGTRHIDATEHQSGLMLAVATESVVKLVAFIGVGAFVVWGMFGGAGDLVEKARQNPDIMRALTFAPDAASWLVTTLIAALAFVLLPRQFHVIVVENRELGDLKKAAWLFPLYLVAINLFVIPIAAAGMLIFPGRVDHDLTVMALPLYANSNLVAAVAVVGALSAATAMVIVETVALGIMVSNDLILPFLLRRSSRHRERGATAVDARMAGEPEPASAADMSGTVLIIRRAAIVVILLLGYLYYRASNEAALASIGLLSFAAASQLAPAFIGGFLWHRGTARGAVAGLIAGILCWAYLLFLPSFAAGNSYVAAFVADGPFGIDWLRPQAFNVFGLTPLVNGVIISLSLNIIAFVGFSLTRHATPIERLQANVFIGVDTGLSGPSFRLWRSAVTVAELRQTVARYLGDERTAREFTEFLTRHGQPENVNGEADAHTIRFAEHLLASVIGAASSRLVLSLMLKRRNVSTEAALKLLDDASAAIQYSRTLLQHALDHAKQGVTVFDSDLRLVCWNRAFQDLFELPHELVRFGVGLDDIIGYNARRGIYGPSSSPDFIASRLESFVHNTEPVRLRLHPLGKVLEIRSNHLPDGGIVTTYTDITEAVEAEEALSQANESLERRVLERTDELVRVNEELARAKAEADDANLSKTRFLAAASHDILQPLNAARLYATSLVERTDATPHAQLAQNVGASLDAVEEILGALLEISRLDTGKLRPEWSVFRIDDLFAQLAVEFDPAVRAKGLELTFVPSGASIRSDRRLMRRALQNLISNAIKYTEKGRVLVGCRRRKGMVRIEVRDTGIGIPASKQRIIFKEFQRLDQGARVARGLGLGLSIVERIARVLNHRIAVTSTAGKGSTFSLEAPIASAEPVTFVPPEVTNASQQPLAGLHVLAIDNDPTILDGLRTLLEGWGCVVATAASFDDAKRTLRLAGNPDVILADYHLDNSDGLDLVRRLRKHARIDLPAVLITADRSTEVRDRAAEMGMQVLNKPLKPAALRAILVTYRPAQEVAAE